MLARERNNMYCTHCGAEYKKSWRMPSKCRDCHAEVVYEPRGWLTVILIVAMAIGAAVGWLTLRIFEVIDPAGGETNLFGRFLAPLLAVAAIIAAYQLVGRLFLLAGLIKSDDLAKEKPAEVASRGPKSGRRLTTQQQIAFNLSKVDLTGQSSVKTSDAVDASTKTTGIASGVAHSGVRIGAQAGMSTATQPHMVRGEGPTGTNLTGKHHGNRMSFSDALSATRRATEEQYSGEAKTTQLVSEAREELIRSGRASAQGSGISAQTSYGGQYDHEVTSAATRQAAMDAGVGTRANAARTEDSDLVSIAATSLDYDPAAGGSGSHTSQPYAAWPTVTHTGTYDEVRANDVQGIREMGALSSAIVKEHFDPIIGPEQNDYMIARFNTAEAITDQLKNQGYRYFFVCDPEASASANAHERHIGFVAFYPRETSEASTQEVSPVDHAKENAQAEGARSTVTKDRGDHTGMSTKAQPESGSAGRELYLSKFYLMAAKRGKGLSHDMCRFVVNQARALGCTRVVLNVNRNNYQAILAYEHLGFHKVREEKNDIGNGYYMDDFVYVLPVS